jgi:hypothetical protein
MPLYGKLISEVYMSQKYQKINFLLIFFCLTFSNYSCSENVSSSVQPNEVKLIYSTKIGWDVYREGDRLGEKIIVYFNGSVEKYTRYYKSEDVLMNTSRISISEVNDLNNLFSEFKFNEYPNILPSTNQIHWPTSGCFISFSQSEIEQAKEVSVIGFEESQYYPSGFYQFLDKLKEKLSSFIN